MPHPQDLPSLPESDLAAVVVDIVNRHALTGGICDKGVSCEAIDEIRAAVITGRAAGRASAEPEGFVLVPREPTRDMISAGVVNTKYVSCTVGQVYAAMLAAAPTPTASIAPKAEEIAERFAGLDADMDALDAALATPKAEGEAARERQFYEHVKSGGIYEVVCRAIDEANPEVSRVIYRSATGVLWDRIASEFDDGRFVHLATYSATPVAQAAAGERPCRCASVGAAMNDGTKLWLWKNGDHYLAFEHLYPCFTPGGDPMTLGEPAGRAIFKAAFDRSNPTTPLPVQEPAGAVEAQERQRIFKAVAAAMPHCNPLLWQDWADGFNVHMEPDDIIAVWRAALASLQPVTQAVDPDMRAICEALGFDPTNHHNAAKCPYCRPVTQAKSGAVAFVDERAISWLKDRLGRKGCSITTKLEAVKSFERPMPLYAAPQEAVERQPLTGWQPIETAPKNHFPVLTRSGKHGCREAFRDVNWNWYWKSGKPADVVPNHWQPLPEPPGVGPATQEKQHG